MAETHTHNIDIAEIPGFHHTCSGYVCHQGIGSTGQAIQQTQPSGEDLAGDMDRAIEEARRLVDIMSRLRRDVERAAGKVTQPPPAPSESGEDAGAPCNDTSQPAKKGFLK